MITISRLLTGRRMITTDETEITRENVADVLLKTENTHSLNANEIDYLYNYYKGNQEIQRKTKEIRTDINNKITENRAYEITEFKKGFIWGEPIQYVRRGVSENDEETSKSISMLNDYMFLANKNEEDTTLAEWLLIGGLGYRMIRFNENWVESSDESPFEITVLDPRNTFIVRRNDIRKEPIMAVACTKDDTVGIEKYYVYTKDKYFEIENGIVIVEKNHYLNEIPIIEYTSGNARLGSFEVVLPLMDALNDLQSNRLDDVEQHVNSFLTIYGADIDEETYAKVEEYKMLILPNGADAKYLSATLQQTDVQTFSDYLYKTILTICGMPNRNDSGGGDNGIAVIYRDGWEIAESQAKTLEKTFKTSERQFLKIALYIFNSALSRKLRLSNIDIKFARRYADNILTKVQAMTQLLDAGIKPDIALATANIWNDPGDVAYQSKEYLKKWNDLDVRDYGQEIVDTEQEDN